MSIDHVKISGIKEEIKVNLETGHFYEPVSSEIEAFVLAHNPRAGGVCFPLEKGRCFTSLEEWRERWVALGSPTFEITISGMTLNEIMEAFPPEICFLD